MMRPRISIIIPSYNYARFLPDSLGSVLAQSFKDYELILVDDGSTDNTQGIVQTFLPKFEGRLKYIRQANQGVAIARNTGISAAKGDYIAFLDADDTWVPQALEMLYAAKERNPECALIYANVEICDGNMKPTTGPRFTNKSSVKPYTGQCFDKLFVYGNFIPIDATIIRKDIFSQVGYFDPRFKCGEDLDMWLRISAVAPINYIDQVLTKLRTHSKSLSFSYMAGAKAEVLMTRRMMYRFPEAAKQLTPRMIDNRLYVAFYSIGIFYILNSKSHRGRKWLQKAWMLESQIFKNKIVFYYLVSFFPLGPFLKNIRSLLHKNR